MSETAEQPARLAGDELEDWYVQGAEQLRRKAERNRRKAWFPWRWVPPVLFVLCAWAIIPLMILLAALLGVWLILGSGSLAKRIFVSALIVLPTNAWDFYVLLANISLVLVTALFCYTFCVLFHWFSKLVTRCPQFSLWEIGMGLLALGLLCGLIRAVLETMERPLLESWMTLPSIFFAYISANVAAACLPIYVPRKDRGNWPMRMAMLSQWLMMPALGCLVGAYLTITVDEDLGLSVCGFTVVGHWIGAGVLWGLIFPMERAGYFREVAEPTTEASS